MAALLAVSIAAMPAMTAAVPIGFLQFDILIPADPDAQLPGTNAFSVANLTGTAAAPPDFPVLEGLTLSAATLHLVRSDDTVLDIPLGDIGPGFLEENGVPPVALQFADTETFALAVFSASLTQLVFGLADGSTFVAASSAVVATLGGVAILPGDFVLIDVAGELRPPPQVAAPPTLLLLGAALGGLLLRRRRPGPRTT